MKEVYELLSKAADILNKVQNKMNESVDAPEIELKANYLANKLYDLRCNLEDIREDVSETFDV